MNLIYILGNNALAYYLATKFIDEGSNKVILLSNQFKKSSKNYNQITVKEDGKLIRKQYQIDTLINIKDKPDLFIIACGMDTIKVEMTTVNKNKVMDCPIICLSGLENDGFLQAFLQKNVEVGYFDGFLQKKNDIITVFGRTPKLLLGKSGDKNVLNMFDKAKIITNLYDDTQLAFWDYFSSYSISYLLYCAYKKPLFELIKNKEHRGLLENLAQDMAKMINKNVANFQIQELLKKIYAVPNMYNFDINVFEVNYIVNIIKKNMVPENSFNNLTKIIYKQLLS